MASGTTELMEAPWLFGCCVGLLVHGSLLVRRCDRGAALSLSSCLLLACVVAPRHCVNHGDHCYWARHVGGMLTPLLLGACCCD